MSIKTLGLFFSLLVLVAALPVHAATCPTATVNTLIGTSCTVGALTFSNFALFNVGFSGSGSPSGGIQSSQLMFAPITDANGTGFTLTPTIPFFANSGGNYDFEFDYVVQSTVALTSMFQSISGVVTGPAFDHINDTYCPGGLGVPPPSNCGPGGTTTPQFDTFLNAPGGTGSSTSKSFSALSLSVQKDVQANAAAFGATLASVTSVSNQFPVGTTPPGVPEPGTFVLLGAGLVGLAAFFRRR